MQVLRAVASKGNDECDAEPAGEGASGGSAKESEPFAADEDPSPSTAIPHSVPQGLPVSHTEFRALKERARTLQNPSNPKDSVAQEDGHGNEKGSEKEDPGKR